MTDSDAPSATAYQPVRAPRGNALSCRGWQQEAALRMLMNSLDPEVAEHPEELIASGGAGKPARNWESFRAIVAELHKLGNEETLLVRDGAPAGVIRTRVDATRVLIIGSDWSYVGTQGALASTYELFSSAARQHFGGTLAGKLVVCGGMGGMGGAIPLAARSNGAACLGIDVDAERIKRRVKTGYCDLLVNSLDEALRILKNAVRKRETASVGLIGNCASVIPELAQRGVVPDLLTDQTPADDPAGDYVPQGLTVEQARALRKREPDAHGARALDSIAAHVRGMLDLQKLGAVAFEYGNQLRAAAHSRGVLDAYDIPDGVETYLQPVSQAGRAPLLWIALSGEESDILRADQLALELFPDDELMLKWLVVARRLPRFQGLPARACWIERSGREEFGFALNELVARSEVAGPMALVRGFAGGLGEEDYAAAKDTDAIAGAPGVDTMLRENIGASWISFLNERDGRARRSNWADVADGTPEAGGRITRAMREARPFE